MKIKICHVALTEHDKLCDWYHYQCMGHISVVTTVESCYSVKIGALRPHQKFIIINFVQ